MELGAIKHSINNEIIRMKNNLNQAKIQIIHKLTRKVKTFREKKNVPEKIKVKLDRKLDNIVKEILIMKKVKPKQLVRFIIQHKDDLKTYLNSSLPNKNKVYARLLQHKALIKIYNDIRAKYAHINVELLLMTKKQRLKMKKELKLKEKNKSASENDEVQVDNSRKTKNCSDEELSQSSDDEFNESEDVEINKMANEEENVLQFGTTDQVSESYESDSEVTQAQVDEFLHKNISKSELVKQEPEEINCNNDTKIKKNNKVMKCINEKPNTTKTKSKKDPKPTKIIKQIMKKNQEVTQHLQNKVADPFFVTETGESYMTLAEPRLPDQVKEIHKRGNRKVRRAEMFGRKPPKQKFYENENPNKKVYSKSSEPTWTLKNDRFSKVDTVLDKRKIDDDEKLHPSWEAKKKNSGIVAFQGKKIVFD